MLICLWALYFFLCRIWGAAGVWTESQRPAWTWPCIRGHDLSALPVTWQQDCSASVMWLGFHHHPYRWRHLQVDVLLNLWHGLLKALTYWPLSSLVRYTWFYTAMMLSDICSGSVIFADLPNFKIIQKYTEAVFFTHNKTRGELIRILFRNDLRHSLWSPAPFLLSRMLSGLLGHARVFLLK